MPAIAVLGAQWGDEGKGKISYLLSEDADMCVRFNGGTNAGHTVVFTRVSVAAGAGGPPIEGFTEAGEFRFHLIPAGTLHPGCIGVLGNGMVVDPKALVDEIEALREIKGEEPQILIGQNAHLLLPYHPIVEALEGAISELDTTAKGIGPAYRDKASRIGLRMADLLFPDIFTEKIKRNLERQKRIWNDQKLRELEVEELAEHILSLSDGFKDRITDTAKLINEALDEGKKVVFEGAQGWLLDIDFGTYPYVTSSSTTLGGIGIGAGVPPNRLNRIVGVAKAYTTRVGAGPFPTEEKGEIGRLLQRRGHEFGTTTGRPRRCGWLDLVALRYGAMLNGFTELALMKLDVLSGLSELKAATAYRYKGKMLQDFPLVLEVLQDCEPVYEQLPGWKEDIRDCRELGELPPEARSYVRFIEDELELPISIISVGPGCEDNVRTF